MNEIQFLDFRNFLGLNVGSHLVLNLYDSILVLNF